MTTLLQASDFARLSNRSTWEFATQLSELENLGVERSAIRWLLLEEIVEIAVEEPTADGLDFESAKQSRHSRSFRPTAELRGADHTCLVLTDAGERLARELFSVLPEYSCMEPPTQIATATPAGSGLLKPTWISAVRELRVGTTLLKRFKKTAPAQETVLATFEEECWPRRIDDPLVPRPDLESKHRVTIHAQRAWH